MLPGRRLPFALAVPALAVASMQLAHCGDGDLSVRDAGRESDATVEGGSVGDDAAAACDASGWLCLSDAGVPTCVADIGWQCAVDTRCGSPTTLRGKVLIPVGCNPLANVVVFVPGDKTHLPAIPGAPTCGASNRCRLATT